MYDYIIVGTGLSGSVCANLLAKHKKRCLVLEQNNFVGGMVHNSYKDGIIIHEYGPHIFHTNNKKIWEYVNSYAKFNNYKLCVKSLYNNKLYDIPFNLNTLKQLYGKMNDEQLLYRFHQQKQIFSHLTNLEEQALSMFGKDIYEIFIKGYTEKQWNQQCNKLPLSIIERMSFRNTHDKYYFTDKYQGVPINGYNELIQNLLDSKYIEIQTNENFDLTMYQNYNIIYTGDVSELYHYVYGKLDYRGLRFIHKKVNQNFVQKYAVINYPSRKVPYTRITEHKHFMKNCKNNISTYISYEYPDDKNKFYPINNNKNNDLYNKYVNLTSGDNLFLCGRLGLYKYLNMDEVVLEAFRLCKKLI